MVQRSSTSFANKKDSDYAPRSVTTPEKQQNRDIHVSMKAEVARGKRGGGGASGVGLGNGLKLSGETFYAGKDVSMVMRRRQ